jgi:hypothetical protein
VEPGQRVQVPLPSSSCARVRCERELPVVDQLLEQAHAADGRGEGELTVRLRGQFIGLALNKLATLASEESPQAL